MPDMNGDELAATIKQEPNCPPIIMVSGFGDLMNASRECPPGVDVVLPKPISRAQLRRAVDNVTRSRSTFPDLAVLPN